MTTLSSAIAANLRQVAMTSTVLVVGAAMAFADGYTYEAPSYYVVPPVLIGRPSLLIPPPVVVSSRPIVPVLPFRVISPYQIAPTFVAPRYAPAPALNPALSAVPGPALQSFFPPPPAPMIETGAIGVGPRRRETNTRELGFGPNRREEIRVTPRGVSAREAFR